MSKNYRHHSVISKQSDAVNNDDHWLKVFESNLVKNSVQPRDNTSINEQINSIMNNSKSKYTSVQNAVENMMERSGLKAYMDNVKSSNKNEPTKPKKVAQQLAPIHDVKEDKDTPEVIKNKPTIARTLSNIIEETRGNMSIPAIIAKLRALHINDISDESLWNDDKLTKLVSFLNLQAKKDNPSNYDNFDQLGKSDHSDNSDVDVSNTDAFSALQPHRA